MLFGRGNLQEERNGTQFSYMWDIIPFGNYNPKTINIWDSPSFSSLSNTCCLRAVLRGDLNYFSLYLKLISCNVSEIGVKFELFLVNPETEQKIFKQPQKEHIFACGESSGFIEYTSYESLLSSSIKRTFIVHDDKLTVGCKVFILPHCNISNTEQCKLSEDLGNLFESEMLSDVTLAVDGHEIKAHKAILAARSVVFAAMFKHEMEERKSNHVAIADIDYEVFKEMIHFIYTGKAPNIDKMAEHLLVAADKYALENLKVICEKEVFANISVETAAETLCFADLHSAVPLKSQTIDFINSHATDVIETQGWRNLITTHSHLICDAFQALVTQHIHKTSPTKCQKMN